MPRRRMIKFEYNNQTRTALELGPDERGGGIWSCYQVEPTEGPRSFKVAKMYDVREIKMDSRAAAYVRYEDLYNLPANYQDIPEYTLAAIRQYVEFRSACGGFLKAVMLNNLQEAFSRADDWNLPAMKSIVMLIHNHIPAACHGSRHAYDKWLS